MSLFKDIFEGEAWKALQDSEGSCLFSDDTSEAEKNAFKDDGDMKLFKDD